MLELKRDFKTFKITAGASGEKRAMMEGIKSSLWVLACFYLLTWAVLMPQTPVFALRIFTCLCTVLCLCYLFF